jgi:hypothetical protein
MGVPAARDLMASRAAVLGIPFDCGFHPTRIGARLACKFQQLACSGLDRSSTDRRAPSR